MFKDEVVVTAVVIAWVILMSLIIAVVLTTPVPAGRVVP